MAVKELQTRIQLKYDTYANWTTNNPTLLAGEVAIATIDVDSNPASTEADHIQNPPTVLFKVGPGAFNSLQWVSAKAADVHSWAKKSEEDFKTWLSTTAGFATDAEVNKIKEDIEAAIAAQKTAYEAADSALAKRVADLESLTTGGDGSIQEQIATAVAKETEEREKADKAIEDKIGTVTEGKTVAEMISDAAKAGTDAAAEVASNLTTHIGVYDAKVTELANAIGANTTAIGEVRTDFEAADLAINKKIGTASDGKDAATVYGAIAKAQADAEASAAEDAAAKVKALKEGEVAANAAAISAMDTAYKAAVSDEAKAREEADTALDTRLGKVEAFFEVTDDETLDTALDTLVEIQEYLNGDGSATGGIIDRVAQAETDIDNLQKEFADGGRVPVVEAAITRIDGEIDGHDTKITNLETFQNTTVPATYETITNATLIRNDVAELQGIVKTGADANATLRNDLGALTTRVTTAEGTLATTTATANTAAADASKNAADILDITKENGIIDTKIAALTDEGGAITAVDAKVTALAGTVAALDDTYVTEDEFATAKEVIKNSISAAQNKADSADSEAARAHGRIDDIAADYLKAADLFIINCGSSSVNIDEFTNSDTPTEA